MSCKLSDHFEWFLLVLKPSESSADWISRAMKCLSSMCDTLSVSSNPAGALMQVMFVEGITGRASHQRIYSSACLLTEPFCSVSNEVLESSNESLFTGIACFTWIRPSMWLYKYVRSPACNGCQAPFSLCFFAGSGSQIPVEWMRRKSRRGSPPRSPVEAKRRKKLAFSSAVEPRQSALGENDGIIMHFLCVLFISSVFFWHFFTRLLREAGRPLFLRWTN